MNLKIDDNIAEYLVTNLTIFENIHPNILTCIGLVFNILIYCEISKSTINNNNLIFFLIFRYLLDVLDGAVARKYNKGSKLGGMLDTLSDTILITILLDYFYKNIVEVKSTVPLIVSLGAFLIYINKINGWFDHQSLKIYEKNNHIHNMAVFVVNNTFLGLLFIYLMIFNSGKHIFI